MSTYKLLCPHCRSRVRIRTSEGVHIFLRLTLLQCTNEACGWSAKGQHEITHELSPSGMPNPEVTLPLADSALRRQVMIAGKAQAQIDLFNAPPVGLPAASFSALSIPPCAG